MSLPKGYQHSEERNRKISETLLGHRHSEETKQKISLARRGKGLGPHSEERKAKTAKANWKGDLAGYGAIHIWLRSNHGSPADCEECGGNGNNRPIEYALKHGHRYTRNPEDYRKLCVRCHRRYDTVLHG